MAHHATELNALKNRIWFLRQAGQDITAEEAQLPRILQQTQDACDFMTATLEVAKIDGQYHIVCAGCGKDYGLRRDLLLEQA